MSLPVAGWDGYGRPNDALLTADDVVSHDRTYMAATLLKVKAWLDMQLTLEAKGVL